MTSGSCSTTITLLPLSRSFCRSSFRRCTSRGCIPMLGSSKMYSTSTRLLLRCLTILMRCDSPPDSVSVSRLRLRYSRPISIMCRSRSIKESTIVAATGSVIVQFLIIIEQNRLGEDVPPPALYGIFREEDSPLVERFGFVKKLVEIDAYLAANAIALRTHALRVVERKGIGIAHERLPDARVQQP